MFQLLFPQYRNRRWVYLPLGTLALTEQRPGKPNPLLDPVFCQQWLRRLHRRYKATCSYGGWFEDRSILWNGHYMMPGFTYHLGVDFTVPAHSRIYSPCEGTVIQVWHDNDTLGGWGGRVIILLKPNVYLVLAHMGTIFVKVGKKLRKGQLIGNVGVPNNNGHWFPHLHVQVVRGKYEGIDGYGEFSPRNQRKFPDPLQFWPTYNVNKPPL